MASFFENTFQFSVEAVPAEFYLNENFPFYRQLNNDNKNKFLNRLTHFVQTKKFVPRQEIQITDEMRVLISACAIQLTFGLDDYNINYFETILVYPDIYQSPHTKYMHHGEVNLAGFICFSWKSLKKGIGANDNFNVGLHEWSHALRFNGFKGSESDGFFEGYFVKWLTVCNGLYNNIRSGREKMFNKYGGSNLSEFFPVLMEHFFENPQSFKEKYPKEFEFTCLLLNIDPLNTADPSGGVRQKITEKFIYKESAVKMYESRGSATNVTWNIVGIVILVFMLIAVLDKQLICSSILFVLFLPPLIIFLIKWRIKTMLTSSGLVRSTKIIDPLHKSTEKYCWEKIIRVEFNHFNDENRPDTDQYNQLDFLVDTGTDFKIISLALRVYGFEAEKLENLFRENGVPVVRHKRGRPTLS